MVEDQENVANEIAEATSEQEVVQPDQSESSESQAHPSQESDKDRNFRELRESKRQVESELRELREQMERIARAQNPQPKVEEEPELSDDDLVEGKHLKRYIQKLEQRLDQQAQASIPDKLKAKFSDFDQVVTPENVEKLKQAEPEMYATLIAGNDLYSKGVSAYKALRNFGIVKSDPYAADKEQVQKSHSRPMSAQAIKGQGALHEANAFAKGLTPELRKQLYQEMVDASKGQS